MALTDKLTAIGNAIRSKTGGTALIPLAEMPARIEAIPSGVPVVLNPALVLWDWEGTKLAEYSRQDALALTELPSPDTLPPYAGADHELLLFQSWNWSLADIKTWLSEHEGETLGVGAIYTTTDGQDHNYWGNPRLTDATLINMHKRATTYIGYNAFSRCYSLKRTSIPDGVTSIGGYSFSYCYSLAQIKIPNGVTSIGGNAFYYCLSLTQINIPDSVTSIGSGAFQSCSSLCDILNESEADLSNTDAFNNLPSIYRIYVPRANLSWYETATNWATIYTEGHIVAIEDYIEYLESLGYNVDKYKEA